MYNVGNCDDVLLHVTIAPALALLFVCTNVQVYYNNNGFLQG